MDDVRNQTWIEEHEGRRLTAYRDSRGYLTVGVGCNLDAPGAAELCAQAGLSYNALRAKFPLSVEECERLFRLQYKQVAAIARGLFPAIDQWPPAAAAVVCDMIFQLGAKGFSDFRNTIACLRARDWKGAAAHIADSLLATQTPNRVKENIALLKGIA